MQNYESFARTSINIKLLFDLWFKMFGISDPWVWSAYLLTLLSTLLCVVWSVVKLKENKE
jgi:heme exporter protein D